MELYQTNVVGKNARSNKITSVEDNPILENNDKIAMTFNNFFTGAVSNCEYSACAVMTSEIMKHYRIFFI